jgi:trehalose 6-phosphate synthase
MRRTFLFIGGVVLIVSIIVFGFTLNQINEQKKSLSADLEYRTSLLADSFQESIEPYYLSNSKTALQNLLDKFADRQRLLGLTVFDNKGNLVAASKGLAQDIVLKSSVAVRAMDLDKSAGEYSNSSVGRIYEFAEPLHQNDAVIGAFAVVQRADYIDKQVSQIWQSNILRILAQVVLFSLIAFLLLRWFILKPIVSITEAIRNARSGRQTEELEEMAEDHEFFSPLTKELSKLSRSLFQARSAASQEARLRFEKLESSWTAERLKEFIKANLKDRKIFMVSNREPYVHNKVRNEIQEPVSIGGMVTAIEPVMEACGGLWVANGMGSADRETADKDGRLQVPPDDPKYTLKRIFLTEEEQKGFYSGFCNEAIWPLCHTAHVRPIFRKEDWQDYRTVNGKFTQSLLSEIKNVENPLILVQDFHLALMPQMIKKSRPDGQVGLFWHIPWPTPENFSICPWHKEILEGMLGADVLGFHTQQYCNNFMETVGKEIESLVDLEQFSITYKGHVTYIKPFPISVAFSGGNETKTKNENGDKILEKYGIKSKYFGLGVDRLDYTKGILERFKGVELFFDKYPNYKGQFTFLQIAEPSRESVERYREFNKQVTGEADRINSELSTEDWSPIVLVKEHLTHKELFPLYRRSDVCVVTSLHDGMNLVSKEFVAARSDEKGVLILSQFAGAWRDLKGAIVVNPYSAEQTASAIHEGLNMPLLEQRRRMKKMRLNLKNYNVYRWAAEFIKAVAGF